MKKDLPRYCDNWTQRYAHKLLKITQNSFSGQVLQHYSVSGQGSAQLQLLVPCLSSPAEPRPFSHPLGSSAFNCLLPSVWFLFPGPGSAAAGRRRPRPPSPPPSPGCSRPLPDVPSTPFWTSDRLLGRFRLCSCRGGCSRQEQQQELQYR